jgi:hypothetical protein
METPTKETFDPNAKYSLQEWEKWKGIWCPSSRKRKIDTIKEDVVKEYKKYKSAKQERKNIVINAVLNLLCRISKS